ncbi:MAG: hypothetical protein ACXWFJ_10075, partial [Candidatus Aminicenantales bacterium]
MKNPFRPVAPGIAPLLLVLVLISPVLTAMPEPQKTEIVDGVRIVHNAKGGLWGKTPKVALELVR